MAIDTASWPKPQDRSPTSRRRGCSVFCTVSPRCSAPSQARRASAAPRIIGFRDAGGTVRCAAFGVADAADAATLRCGDVRARRPCALLGRRSDRQRRNRPTHTTPMNTPFTMTSSRHRLRMEPFAVQTRVLRDRTDRAASPRPVCRRRPAIDSPSICLFTSFASAFTRPAARGPRGLGGTLATQVRRHADPDIPSGRNRR